MEFLNFAFSLITGWSFGYISTLYRTKEYERYYPLFFYFNLLLLAAYTDTDMLPIIGGMFMFVLSSIFIFDPLLPNGYRIYKDNL